MRLHERKGPLRAAIAMVFAASLGAAAPVFAEDITLRMPSWWFGEPGNKAWLDKAISDFESENAGIKVDGYNLGYGGYADQMLIEMSSGTAPDVIHLLNMNMGDFLRNDLLAPLDDYMAGSEISPETYPAAQFSSPVISDGSTYGVIHMVANYLPFYNTKLLAEAGYDEFPDNPDDFLEMVKKLTNAPEQFGYAAMVKPGSYVQTYMDVTQWVMANGGNWAVGGRPTVDAPANIEALEQFKAVFDAGVMPRDIDKSTYRQMWWEGKVAVLFDGSWMMGFAREKNPEIVPILKAAQMPWPGHRTAAAYQIWSVPAGSKHPEEAFKLIQHLQNAQWQQEMVQMTGAISPRLNNLPDGYLEKNEWFAPFQEASDKYSESIMPAGLETYGNEVLKIISDQIELILYSDVPIDEALAQAQSEVVALVGQ